MHVMKVAGGERQLSIRKNQGPSSYALGTRFGVLSLDQRWPSPLPESGRSVRQAHYTIRGHQLTSRLVPASPCLRRPVTGYLNIGPSVT